MSRKHLRKSHRLLESFIQGYVAKHADAVQENSTDGKVFRKRLLRMMHMKSMLLKLGIDDRRKHTMSNVEFYEELNKYYLLSRFTLGGIADTLEASQVDPDEIVTVIIKLRELFDDLMNKRPEIELPFTDRREVID